MRIASKENKIAALVLVVVLLLCAGWFLYPNLVRTTNAIAVVSLNGVRIQEIPLSREDFLLDLTAQGIPIQLELKNHAIRFQYADCPDQICVNTGFLAHPMQTAVCLPNQTAVFIEEAQHS